MVCYMLYGMLYGMVCYDILWCGMLWYIMVWYVMVYYNVVWYVMVYTYGMVYMV